MREMQAEKGEEEIGPIFEDIHGEVERIKEFDAKWEALTIPVESIRKEILEEIEIANEVLEFENPENDYYCMEFQEREITEEEMRERLERFENDPDIESITSAIKRNLLMEMVVPVERSDCDVEMS